MQSYRMDCQGGGQPKEPNGMRTKIAKENDISHGSESTPKLKKTIMKALTPGKCPQDLLVLWISVDALENSSEELERERKEKLRLKALEERRL